MDFPNECWTDVDSYDEVYAVSNIGRIRNSRTGLVLKARINRTGYLIVDLCKKGDKTMFPVHKLVADAFLELTEDEDQIFIDHINNNKLDNTICNLRRASRSQIIGIAQSKQIRPVVIKVFIKTRSQQNGLLR